MNKQMLLTTGVTVFLALSLQGSQEQLAKSIKDARMETGRTANQLKSTLDAITAMTKQAKGDLKPAYDAFCKEVSKTGDAAAATKKQVAWMSGEGRQYFTDWQKSVDGISNESLRKKAQKRLNAVKESYEKVESSLNTANEKFTPFLSDLSDIQKALATDLTAGGVKAIRGTVKTANWDHQFVDKAIKSALKEMDRMEKSLSSEAN